jgi:hypothetical protein
MRAIERRERGNAHQGASERTERGARLAEIEREDLEVGSHEPAAAEREVSREVSRERERERERERLAALVSRRVSREVSTEREGLAANLPLRGTPR